MRQENGTRERILNTAEEMFSSQGIGATSLRAVTREADVNLAAVHYHFGSKEALLDAVVERRAKPVNDQRLAELARLTENRLTERRPTESRLTEPARTRATAGSDGPSVEEILHAFLMPAVRSLEAHEDHRERLPRLLARIEAQPPELVEALWRKHFGEVGRHFLEALQEALPELPKNLVADRFRLALGTLSHLFSGNFDLDIIPGHPAQASADALRAVQVIDFLAAGLKAPASANSECVAPLQEASA